MAVSLADVTKGVTKRGQCTVIYGVGSVGKTRFMADIMLAKGGLVISGEDGMREAKMEAIAKTPVISSWENFQEWLRFLLVEKHDYKVVAIDTLDAIVDKLDEYVTKTYYGGSEEKANAFQKKYVQYTFEFAKILSAFAMLQNKGITVIPVLHGVVTKMKVPDAEEYKRWKIDLPESGKESLTDDLFNYADNVLFASCDVVVKDGKGTGTSRVVHTEWSPSYDAKNRCEDVPALLALDYSIVSKYNLF